MQVLGKFIIKSIVYTILIFIVSFILFQTVLKSYYLPAFWFLLLFIAGLTIAFHTFLIRISEKELSKFSSNFILISGVKMMIYLVFIIGYSFLNPKHAVIFLISFLVLYVLYTVFEVILIIAFLKRKN
ncbi:MAG: hypothetical protein A2X13_12110 [Bacteroidetes bacterium GWC2_33_15]|nr:MAG: hypothetical protein A2X10_06135 [Bacteroidetes bacterium GWA2_33_15]OFX50878.1 MAG: hypothetical protein A2X13_12110 [Bacteroidetes bacterium GWC2_33_15]OFX62839.1 MAG: hypothetical protein A2X15_09260 [Bacteroidetes bacterium GWB2_32_14]OFX69909.1 MAG: hypothetical protein A2X14_02120 [Bacteroidetes bacterium GWD2_33_33]HAN18900.1 hypothetical protein [Bacteroidales bacterium]